MAITMKRLLRLRDSWGMKISIRVRLLHNFVPSQEYVQFVQIHVEFAMV